MYNSHHQPHSPFTPCDRLVSSTSSLEDKEEADQEEFIDENDENQDPKAKNEESDASMWSLREPKKEPKWCGSHVFFSSSDEENADEDMEDNNQGSDEQMDLIERQFTALTADV